MRTHSRRARRVAERNQKLVAVIPFEFEDKEVLLARKVSPRRKRNGQLGVISEIIPPGAEASLAVISVLGRLGCEPRLAAQVFKTIPQQVIVLVAQPQVPYCGETHITCYPVSLSLRTLPRVGSSGDSKIEYERCGYPQVLVREELSPKLRWILPLVVDRRARPQHPILIDKWE